jgi:quercetin dioxygenase-like cupin family protein
MCEDLSQQEALPMAIHHSQPGEVINVRPLEADLATAPSRTLLKTDQLEIIRLVMASGKVLAEHKAPGAITVHCIEGRIAFTALGRTRELTAGELIYLPAETPHSVRCIENASFLLTILLHPRSASCDHGHP